MSTPSWVAALLKAKRIARRYPAVIGVDYGTAYKDDEPLSRPAIRFHVRKKRAVSELAPAEILPGKLAEVRCDVIEASYALHGSPHHECTPLQPGISVGNLEHPSTGTLGLFASLPGQAGTYLLSNWHVLCGSLSAAEGDSICQPGPHDAGSQPARVVARLSKWASLATGIDAAIALVDVSLATSATVFGGNLSVGDFEHPRRGMKLVKAGAFSGFTHGVVDGVDGAWEMNYAPYGDQVRWMDGIRIKRDADFPETEISVAGDSGSAWLNAETGKVVALHFAGEDGLGPSEEYALAHPIGRVFGLLGVGL